KPVTPPDRPPRTHAHEGRASPGRAYTDLPDRFRSGVGEHVAPRIVAAPRPGIHDRAPRAADPLNLMRGLLLGRCAVLALNERRLGRALGALEAPAELRTNPCRWVVTVAVLRACRSGDRQAQEDCGGKQPGTLGPRAYGHHVVPPPFCAPSRSA